MKKVSFLWKWAFLLLSGVILILVAIGLWTFYTLPESDREPVNFPVQEETINGQADLSTTSFNSTITNNIILCMVYSKPNSNCKHIAS